MTVRGSLSLREAISELGVTEITVRRDFANLERAGLAERTWGGLLARQPLVPEITLDERRQSQPQAKQLIGELAGSRIKDGWTIFISGGSTALAVARALHGRKRLNVITTSLSALSLLSPNTEMVVIALGGKASPYNDDLTGPQVLDGLERYRADLAVIGASGITEEGVFNANIERSAINQKMIEQARRTFIVADHTKIGRSALTLLSPPGPALTLITDRPISERVQEAFSAAACEVLVPESSPSKTTTPHGHDATSA